MRTVPVPAVKRRYSLPSNGFDGIFPFSQWELFANYFTIAPICCAATTDVRRHPATVQDFGVWPVGADVKRELILGCRHPVRFPVGTFWVHSGLDRVENSIRAFFSASVSFSSKFLS